MERNDVMMFNNLVYLIYESDDFLKTRKNLLNQIRMLIPYSYASILLSDLNPARPGFRDPVCAPENFLSAEEKYIRIAHKDHTLWSAASGYAVVFCESQVLPDHKRLNTPIYRECYNEYHIYDTLQANITYNNTFLGVITLYRTRQLGAFSDEDVVYLRMIGYHLNRLFYRILAADTDGRRDRESAAARDLAHKYALTVREEEILEMLLAGDPESAISGRLSIAPSTLKKHMQHIYRKMGISTRWELLRFK